MTPWRPALRPPGGETWTTAGRVSSTACSSAVCSNVCASRRAEAFTAQVRDVIRDEFTAGLLALSWHLEARFMSSWPWCAWEGYGCEPVGAIGPEQYETIAAHTGALKKSMQDMDNRLVAAKQQQESLFTELKEMLQSIASRTSSQGELNRVPAGPSEPGLAKTLPHDCNGYSHDCPHGVVHASSVGTVAGKVVFADGSPAGDSDLVELGLLPGPLGLPHADTSACLARSSDEDEDELAKHDPEQACGGAHLELLRGGTARSCSRNKSGSPSVYKEAIVEHSFDSAAAATEIGSSSLRMSAFLQRVLRPVRASSPHAPALESCPGSSCSAGFVAARSVSDATSDGEPFLASGSLRRSSWICIQCGGDYCLERDPSDPSVAYCSECWDKWAGHRSQRGRRKRRGKVSGKPGWLPVFPLAAALLASTSACVLRPGAVWRRMLRWHFPWQQPSWHPWPGALLQGLFFWCLRYLPQYVH